jgi:HNH endonuclease/AP2 domain
MAHLTTSKGEKIEVDDDDVHWLGRFKWFVIESCGNKYARTNICQHSTPMHRLIHPDGIMVDHRDGNSLNNRKSNLRAATKAQNSQNKKKRAGTTSRYKGVMWCPANSKWAARISRRGSEKKVAYHLGYFLSERTAGEAYDRAASDMFGCFAATNGLAE